MKMNLANQMMASRGLVPQGRWLGYMMTAHMLEGDLAVSPGALLHHPGWRAVFAVAFAVAFALASAGRSASAEGFTRLLVSRCTLALLQLTMPVSLTCLLRYPAELHSPLLRTAVQGTKPPLWCP